MKELLGSNYSVALTGQHRTLDRWSTLSCRPCRALAVRGRGLFLSRQDWFFLLYLQITACNMGSVFGKWGLNCCL